MVGRRDEFFLAITMADSGHQGVTFELSWLRHLYVKSQGGYSLGLFKDGYFPVGTVAYLGLCDA